MQRNQAQAFQEHRVPRARSKNPTASEGKEIGIDKEVLYTDCKVLEKKEQRSGSGSADKWIDLVCVSASWEAETQVNRKQH
jgi:hypothetical protein